MPIEKTLQEGVDWRVVSRMGHFGQGPYLTESSVYSPAYSDVPFYWVVKQTPRIVNRASLLGVSDCPSMNGSEKILFQKSHEATRIELFSVLTGFYR